jgi:hypothetical protein
MLHEPKFWVVALALAALFGEGVNLMLTPGRRILGVGLTVLALVGFSLLYFGWPESKTSHVITPSIAQTRTTAAGVAAFMVVEAVVGEVAWQVQGVMAAMEIITDQAHLSLGTAVTAKAVAECSKISERDISCFVAEAAVGAELVASLVVKQEILKTVWICKRLNQFHQNKD